MHHKHKQFEAQESNFGSRGGNFRMEHLLKHEELRNEIFWKGQKAR